jgi:hypothetical protein
LGEESQDRIDLGSGRPANHRDQRIAFSKQA